MLEIRRLKLQHFRLDHLLEIRKFLMFKIVIRLVIVTLNIAALQSKFKQERIGRDFCD